MRSHLSAAVPAVHDLHCQTFSAWTAAHPFPRSDPMDFPPLAQQSGMDLLDVPLQAGIIISFIVFGIALFFIKRGAAKKQPPEPGDKPSA